MTKKDRAMSNYDSYLESSLEYLKQYIKEMKSRSILFVGSVYPQRYIHKSFELVRFVKVISKRKPCELYLDYLYEQKGLIR
jgi:hypothetical protein